jgi:hypothetical protein
LALEQTSYKVSYDNQADASGLKSLTATGKYHKGQGYALTLAMTSGDTSVSADVVFDQQGNSYYNYTHMNSTVKNDLQAQEFAAFLQALQAKHGPRWIKTSSGSPQDSSACVLVGVQKLQKDTAAEEALMNALAQTGGIKITAVSSSDNTAIYDLQAKTDHADGLMKTYQGSDLYKTLTQCSPSYSVMSSTVATVARQVTARVTIDKKARQIKAATITDKSGGSVAKIDFSLTPTRGVTVTVPQDVISLPAEGVSAQ